MREDYNRKQNIFHSRLIQEILEILDNYTVA